MWRHTIQSLSIVTCVFIGSLSVVGQSTQTSTQLQSNSSIERTLGRGEVHSYTISLSDGQYVNFTVMQRGVDVIVRAFSPSGKSLGEFDSPNGGDGPENGTFTAVTGGEYRLVIAALDPSGAASQGKYEIKIIELRDATEQELQVGKNEEKRKAKGIELLKELVDSLPEIRQPQTRMRLKMDCAHLLWDLDAKKAAKLLTEVVAEVQAYSESTKGENLESEEALQWAWQFRFEAIQTLAVHDPEAALNLFRSTAKGQSPQGMYPGGNDQDREFEMTLVNQIAKNNPKRAYDFAQESLKKGYSMSLLQTLRKLSETDKDLASQLGNSIVDKLVGESLSSRTEGDQLAMSLIRESPNDLISSELRRKLLQKALDDIANTKISSNMFATMEGNHAINLISQLKSMGPIADSIIPGTSALIAKKMEEFAAKNEGMRDWTVVDSQTTEENFSITEKLADVPEFARLAVVSQIAEQSVKTGDFAKARQAIEQISLDPRMRQRMLEQLEYQAAMSDAAKGKMEDALGHVARIPGTRERAMILSEIAGRIGPGYKRAAAIGMLEQARSLTGAELYATDQYQMLARLQVAAVFARYDAKRGFEMMDPIVDQFNELTEAAKKLDGFGTTFFVGGELSTQNGNGLQAVAKPMTNAIGSLSVVDFERAKSLADRIGLPEVKLSAFMSLAQQAISPTTNYSPSAAYLNIRNR